jgi:hypothetical protein
LIRFALAVTAVEVALTLAASLWISFAETGEPFLPEEDFEMLGIPIEKYSTDRRRRFDSPFSYDTQVVVKGAGPAITVSVRVLAPRAEYDARLSGEQWPKLRPGDEPPTVTDESLPGEPGYGVRQRGANGVRAEAVRLHGAVMLIVRAIRMNVQDTPPGLQVTRCERLVRTLQEYMMVRLGWREGGAR